MKFYIAHYSSILVLMRTSGLLLFLSVSWPTEIVCVGYLRPENRISTNTDQWTVGVVVSKAPIEQGVRNMSEAGQLLKSEHLELKEELDKEKRVLV